MEMPLERFRQAQPGARVRLGKKLAQIPLARINDHVPPGMRDRVEELRKQLIAVVTSGGL